MKVILRQNVETLGSVGDVVNVKEGYALNYLLPKGVAYAASASNMRLFEEEKKQLLARHNRELKSAEKIAVELEKPENSVTIQMQVGEGDKLFGSVTKDMIAEKLGEKGFTIDKRQIEIDDPIKVLGVYTVNVRLMSQVNAKVKVWVVQ
jgi:large subunit ribosomal protein L9